MLVLGIAGSLRRGSYNHQVLDAAAALFPDDVDFVVFDGLKAVPPYDEDDDVAPAPAGAAAFRAAIAGADAVLFSTPEYNSSVPGQLKNALDWASRPLATNALGNKPVAVVGASRGAFGAVWSQAELRKVLAATGARVVEGEVAFGQAHERFVDGELVDEELREQLQGVVDALVATARERERARVASQVLQTPQSIARR